MKENFTPRRSKTREILDEVQPHWVAIASAVAALASAAISAQQQAKAKAKSKRSASAADAAARGGLTTSSSSPTAARFREGGPSEIGKEGGDMATRLSDLLDKKQAPSATPSQGQPKLDPMTNAPDAPVIDMTTKSAPPEPMRNEAPPTIDMTTRVSPAYTPKADAQQQGQATTAKAGSGTADIGGYAGLATQALGIYQQLKNSSQPAVSPLSQLGPMDLTPTATRFGLQR